jgi:hypothetical protein
MSTSLRQGLTVNSTSIKSQSLRLGGLGLFASHFFIQLISVGFAVEIVTIAERETCIGGVLAYLAPAGGGCHQNLQTKMATPVGLEPTT